MLYDKRHEVQAEPVVPVVKDEPWRKVLREAANILQEKGWCQCQAEDRFGHVCMAQAISLACKKDFSLYGETTMRFRTILGMEAVHWNDTEGRTKEQVIAKLREVAES